MSLFVWWDSRWPETEKSHVFFAVAISKEKEEKRKEMYLGSLFHRQLGYDDLRCFLFVFFFKHTVDGSEIRLTSWYGKYHIYKALYIPGGCLGVLPSTVFMDYYLANLFFRWILQPLTKWFVDVCFPNRLCLNRWTHRTRTNARLYACHGRVYFFLGGGNWNIFGIWYLGNMIQFDGCIFLKKVGWFSHQLVLFLFSFCFFFVAMFLSSLTCFSLFFFDWSRPPWTSFHRSPGPVPCQQKEQGLLEWPISALEIWHLFVFQH